MSKMECLFFPQVSPTCCLPHFSSLATPSIPSICPDQKPGSHPSMFSFSHMSHATHNQIPLALTICPELDHFPPPPYYPLGPSHHYLSTWIIPVALSLASLLHSCFCYILITILRMRGTQTHNDTATLYTEGYTEACTGH